MTQRLDVGRSDLDYLSTLEDGYVWSDTMHWKDPVSITYFFSDDLSPWTNIERAAYRSAAQAWSNVANVTFQEVNSAGAADIVEHLTTPGAYIESGEVESHYVGANGYFDDESFGWDFQNPTGGLTVGGAGYRTMLEGVGHALGLRQPYVDYPFGQSFRGVDNTWDTGDNGQNNGGFTVMSRVALWDPATTGGFQHQNETGQTAWYAPSGLPVTNYGYFAGPMAYDIAAIQDLYGANMSYHSGNDSYVLPDVNSVGTYWTCIWDAGGEDEIRYNGSRNVTIDLGQAYTDGDYDASGGAFSYAQGIHGGFTIARNAVIENAYGGSGNDTISGNGANNRIDGGTGADNMSGGGGNDVYYVDNAGDFVYDSGGSADWVYSRLTSYTLVDNPNGAYVNRAGIENINYVGPSSTNFVGTGNASANEIIGWAGDDRIDGKGGADLMKGLSGNDTYYVDNTGDVIEESPTGGTADWALVTLTTFTLPANVENLNYIGSSGLDFRGTGNASANIIIGYGGADLLDGKGGADQMQGYGGNDTFIVDNGGDTIIEQTNSGTDLVKSAVTFTLAANVENLTLLGTADINGTGNTGDNVITGNTGKNILSGGAGADTMSGGIGNDVLSGAGGVDTLNGGAGNDTYQLANDTTDHIADASGIDTIGSTITRSLAGYGMIENLVLQGATAINGTGNGLANALAGNGANNVLKGGALNDVLSGGLGTDSLFGESGDDRFQFSTVADTAVGAARDIIYDFDKAGMGNDVIDLRSVTPPVMTFMGTGGFTAAGQVRIQQAGSNVLVQINTVGPAGAESEILIIGATIGTGVGQVEAGDFLL